MAGMNPMYDPTQSPIAPYRQTAGPGMAGALGAPPAVAGGDPQAAQVSAQQAAMQRQQYIDSLQNLSKMPGGAAMAQDALNKYDASVQGQGSGDTSQQYYLRQNGGGAYMTTPGSPTGYMYGATSGQAGIDQRAWTNVNDPNAYQYGGQPGGDVSEENRYSQMGQAASGNAAPQMNLSQFYALQNGMGANANAAGSDAMSMARATAMGQTPSVANAQMMAGVNATARAQNQQAASARGGGANLVAAEQLASSAAGNAQANYVTQAGAQAAQERLNAQQVYGSMANAQQSAYAQQAGLASQNAYQQAGFQLNQNQLNQNGQLAYEGMRQGVFNSQQNAQMQGEAQNANTGATAAQLQATKDANDKAFQRQVIGGALTAIGTVGGAAIGGPAGAAGGAALGQAAGAAATSDVRAKSNIRDGGAAIDQTLGQMGAYQYEYNRPDLPKGTQTGTMAQQLLGTPAGAPLVARDEHGRLVIQGPQATNFSLAALARLNDRVQQLEGQQGGTAALPPAAPGEIGPPAPYSPPPGTKLYETAQSTAPRHNPLTGAAYSYHPSDAQIYSDRAKAMQLARGVGPDPNVIPEHDTIIPAGTYAEMLAQQQKNELTNHGAVSTQGMYNAGR